MNVLFRLVANQLLSVTFPFYPLLADFYLFLRIKFNFHKIDSQMLVSCIIIFLMYLEYHVHLERDIWNTLSTVQIHAPTCTLLKFHKNKSDYNGIFQDFLIISIKQVRAEKSPYFDDDTEDDVDKDY